MKDSLKYFLKDSIRKAVDFSTTAQSLGMAPPPMEKPFPSDAVLIPLPPSQHWTAISAISVRDVIAARESHRSFHTEPLSLEELSFLLWATQGVRKVASGHAFRTVPSAGCRHTFETYLAVFRVTGLAKALYRYLPLEHALIEVSCPEPLEGQVQRAALGQGFVGKGAATFLWTTIPERMEWRYGDAAYKVIALDAGHVCQNLYLACAAIGAGTCAVGAYDQEASDALLGVDGDEEFTIYMAPVGKV
jgi:SagB-type dehydrogenase family enzyme